MSNEWTTGDREIVADGLRAAIEGQFFPKWEFHTLVGVTRDELREVYARWLQGAESRGDADAIVSTLVNLIHYPHQLADEVQNQMLDRSQHIEDVPSRYAKHSDASGL